MSTPSIFTAMSEYNCCLLTDDHRYGSGIGVALVPLEQAHIFDELMSASGSNAFVFSYNCRPVTELPFVFAPTFDEAVMKLEKRLADGKTHNPRLYLEPLLEAVEWCQVSGAVRSDECWHTKYRNLYAEQLREIELAEARRAEEAKNPREPIMFSMARPAVPSCVWAGTRIASRKERRHVAESPVSPAFDPDSLLAKLLQALPK